MKDTSAVLDSLKRRIEALTPPSQIGRDDVFRVVIGDPDQVPAGRVVRLTAQPGVQKFPGRNLTDWQTTVELDTGYANVPTDPAQPSAWQQAISDSECLLADLYVWSVETDGVTQLTADYGQIANTGDGFLKVTRTLRVEYTRG